MTHVSLRFAAFTLFVGALVGCDSQNNTNESGNTEPPLNEETTYDGPTQHTIPVGVEHLFSETLTDPNGLNPKRISVEVEGGPTAVISATSPTSVRIEIRFTPASADDDVIIVISGVDEDGFDIKPRTITLDAEVITDARASVTDLSPGRGIAGRSTTILIRGTDPDGLVSGYIEANGQRFEEIFDATTAEIEASVLLPGSGLSYSGGFLDLKGNTTNFTGTVDALGRASVRILFRTFFSKETGSGSVDFVLQDARVAWDTTVVTDGSGWAEWDVPVGRHSVILHSPASASPLIRLKATPAVLNDSGALWTSSGSHINARGETQSNNRVTYAVTDVRGLPFSLDISRDFTSFAEYVTDSAFLDKMSRQVKDNELVLYGAQDPITFVVYDGPCDVLWDFRASGCGSGTPPGASATQSRLKNHQKWYEHIVSLISGSIVGGDPFIMKRKVIDVTSIEPLLQRWTDKEITARRGFAIARFSDSNDKNYGSGTYKPDNGPWFVLRTQNTLRGDRVMDFAHLGNLVFGQSRTTSQFVEQVCSVMDTRPRNALNCPPEEPDVQREFDDRFIQIAVAYGSWAQYQKTARGRGFNVKLK